jgi:hypothetical protein
LSSSRFGFRFLQPKYQASCSRSHSAPRLLRQTHDCVSEFCKRTTHMKFAREYRAHLEAEGYPPDWVDSAVSYSKLKKCVNRVQLELSALGLDVETLRQLLTAVEKDQAHQGVRDGRPFQYRFADGEDPNTIRPELLFVVDGETGEPLHARLAPGTKSYLHRLAVAERLTEVRISDDATSVHATGDDIEAQGDSSSPRRRLVRVPLSSDSDFFSLLEKDLGNIAGLQAVRKQRLTEEIMDVARMLRKATNPELSSKSKHDLAQWRRLFELYLQCNVFFAMNEQDHGTQSGSQARVRFAKFLETAQKSSLLSHFKTLESKAALQNFVAINTELLQFVRFWEINQLAMVKILKSTTLEIGHDTIADQSRVRQTDRPGSETHISYASAGFAFIPGPFKGPFGRGFQQDPRRGASARRLSVPHLLRPRLSPNKAQVRPSVLHTMPHCHAARGAEALCALPGGRRHGG